MNKKLILLISTIILFVAVGLGLFILNRNTSVKPSAKTEKLTQIRIGWQTPWATQGQLAVILKKTNILNENGLDGEFKGFTSGAPLNEAALANQLDIIFTADQPAATLLSKNPNWVIIARLMYNRVSLYVPPKSPIKEIKDLRGKTVGMPFGAAAQRMALKAEEDAGLNPQVDVNNVNLGILEQSDLVKDPNATRWGEMDALAGFDPTPAIFEEKGLIRNLKVGRVVSVVMMSKNYITKHPKSPQQFLKAFYQSYDFYRKNTSKADAMFIDESKLNVSKKALAIAASVEPNVQAKSNRDIRLGFTKDDYNVLQEAADFIYNQGLITQKVAMKDFVNLTYLQKAGLK